MKFFRKTLIFIYFTLITEFVWGLKVDCSFDFEFGIFTLPTNNYNVVRYFPKITIDDFKLSLGLNFFYETNATYNYNDFIDWQSILSKIEASYYKTNFIQFSVKREEAFTLGDGFVVSRFSTSRYYPYFYYPAGYLSLNFYYGGVELFIENLLDPDIFGGRLYLKPLFFLSNTLLKDTTISFVLVDDSDPSNPFSFTNKEHIFAFGDGAENYDIMVYSVGGNFPLINLKEDLFSISAKCNYGSIKDMGNGIEAGMFGKILKYILYGLDYGFAKAGFLPHYFDEFYYAERSRNFESLKEISEGYQFYKVTLGFSAFQDGLKLITEIENKGFKSEMYDVYLFIKMEKEYFKILDVYLGYLRKNVMSAGEFFSPLSYGSIFLLKFDFYLSERIIYGVDYRYNFTFSSTEIVPYNSLYMYIKTLF